MLEDLAWLILSFNQASFYYTTGQNLRIGICRLLTVYYGGSCVVFHLVYKQLLQRCWHLMQLSKAQGIQAWPQICASV